MSLSPPSDAEIRPVLREMLLAMHRHHRDTAIIEELGLQRGNARVDIVVVNGAIHGYEIKSDRDTLRRLSGQISLYSQCLDQVTLVVGDRHLHEALSLLPAWWGVLRVKRTDSGLEFDDLRSPMLNPIRDARVLAELLWRDDAVRLLRCHGLDNGIRYKPRRIVWDRISERLPIDVVAAAVRSRLKARAELRPLR